MFDDDDDSAYEDRHERIRNMPIFKKGKEIFAAVREIGQLIPEDNEILQDIRGIMYEDAALLSVKIAGAEAGDLYDIRMECAAIIRKAANELMIQNHSLEDFGFEHTEYYQAIRDLIEEYRLLFIDWVSKFDPWNYIIDRWGLFNPPGVSAFDPDPDDDIPWDDPDI